MSENDEIEFNEEDKIFFESMNHKEKVNSDLFFRKKDYMERLRTLKFLEDDYKSMIDETKKAISEKEDALLERDNQYSVLVEIEKKFNHKNYDFQKLIEFSLSITNMNRDIFLSKFEEFKKETKCVPWRGCGGKIGYCIYCGKKV